MYNDEMRKASLKEIKADLVLKNARWLNVFTKEILSGDIAVHQGIIVGTGSYEGVKNVDLERRIVVPGFVDSHLHIESSMVTPVQLCQEVLPWGTTTLIADPHEIGNVKGLEAIRFFLDQDEEADCNLFFMLPSCVPATNLDDSGAILTAEDLLELKDHPQVLGLGEMMNYVGVLNGDEEVYKKLNAFKDCVIDGHAPLVVGEQLQAYCLSGVQTDHEVSTEQEAVERIRCGMFVNIREGSAAKNLETICRAILKHDLNRSRFGFCTDDKNLEDIRKDGHIRFNIKKAIQCGIEPAEAYCMASFYSAAFYGLSGIGAIAPGYQADLVVLDDYEQVNINSVYRNGEKYIKPEQRELDLELIKFHSVNPGEITAKRFEMKATHEPQPVIKLEPNQLITKCEYVKIPRKNGLFVPDSHYQKAAVLERHKATGHTGVCAVEGFSVRGAIASTVAHDSHNLIVIGDNDRDMACAAKELVRCQGGYTLVQDGKVLATLELPVYGLITNKKPESVEKKLQEMLKIAHNMGIPDNFDPFMTMSFLSLPVIPEIKITDRGLVILK